MAKGMSSHIADTDIFGMEPRLTSRLQQGSAVDRDQVLLNNDSLGRDVVNRDRGRTVGIEACFQGIEVVLKIAAPARRQQEIPFCVEPGIGLDNNFIPRPDIDECATVYDAQAAIGLGVDLTKDVAGASRRNNDRARADKLCAGSNIDLGEINQRLEARVDGRGSTQPSTPAYMAANASKAT